FLSFVLLAGLDVWPQVDEEKPSMVGLIKSGSGLVENEVASLYQLSKGQIQQLALGISNDWVETKDSTKIFLTTIADAPSKVIASVNSSYDLTENSLTKFSLSDFSRERFLDLRYGSKLALGYLIPDSLSSSAPSLHPIQTV